MKIYVAAHCRWAASWVAKELTDQGCRVISTWHTTPFNPTESHSESDRKRIAAQDAQEVEDADALVLIAGPDKYSGGKFVEAGIALALKKPVVVLGRRENMLLWHHLVSAVNEPSELREAIENYYP